MSIQHRYEPSQRPKKHYKKDYAKDFVKNPEGLSDSIQYGAVIGFPIRHSLSPNIYESLATGLGIPFSFRKLQVPAQKLPLFVKSAKDLDLFRGFAITLPHKEKVIPHLDRCTETVQVLGAVNIVSLENGLAVGHNTDVFGILQTWDEYRVPIKGKRVVVLGAGGAALSVGYAAGLQKAKSCLFLNRDLKRGRKIAKRLARVFPQTEFFGNALPLEGFDPGSDLYVNATPLGMAGFPSISLFKKFPKKNPKVWAFDLVYRPMITPFLSEASTKGIQPIGGLDMLVWQAIEAWGIWHGPIKKPARWKKEIYQRLAKFLDQV